MKIQIISIFPDMLEPILSTSMLRKATEIDAVSYELINLRDYGVGPRQQVDDTPYGGGDGMVLMIEPLMKAVEVAKSRDATARVLLMTPRGSDWSQAKAQAYADDNRGLILICGRYEGYDERIVSVVDDAICIGKYVLTGGELPALVVIDSVVRLLPGVLGGETSAEIESFVGDPDTVEAPQYTRPSEYAGLSVPDVLLSGNHAQIEQWRQDNGHK